MAMPELCGSYSKKGNNAIITLRFCATGLVVIMSDAGSVIVPSTRPRSTQPTPWWISNNIVNSVTAWFVDARCLTVCKSWCNVVYTAIYVRVLVFSPLHTSCETHSYTNNQFRIKRENIYTEGWAHHEVMTDDEELTLALCCDQNNQKSVSNCPPHLQIVTDISKNSTTYVLMWYQCQD